MPVLDMNQRERERLTASLKGMLEDIEKIVSMLEAGEDNIAELIVPCLLLSLKGPTVGELLKILADSMKNTAPDDISGIDEKEK